MELLGEKSVPETLHLLYISHRTTWIEIGPSRWKSGN